MVTASIFPPLRTSLSVNDVVEIAAPKIEGHVLPGEELSWRRRGYGPDRRRTRQIDQSARLSGRPPMFGPSPSRRGGWPGDSPSRVGSRTIDKIGRAWCRGTVGQDG